VRMNKAKSRHKALHCHTCYDQQCDAQALQCDEERREVSACLSDAVHDAAPVWRDAMRSAQACSNGQQGIPLQLGKGAANPNEIHEGTKKA
ncbi:hypothetical protein HAX54_004003, partial [Datura stramonium]|nr:hypothetical protein [Datura stramonium]